MSIALQNPVARLASRVARLAAARDGHDLLLLLSGRDLPAVSKDGSEPAEVIWEAVTHVLHPSASQLKGLEEAAAQCVHLIRHQLTAGGESSSISDAAAVSSESLAYNTFLLSSLLPAHPQVFEALATISPQAATFPLQWRKRVSGQWVTALARQQTDARFVEEWIERLKAASAELDGADMLSEYAEALVLWQSLLWSPPSEGGDAWSRLGRGLEALAGNKEDVPSPLRAKIVVTSLAQVEAVLPGLFGREEARVALSDLPVWVQALVEDRWPEESLPEHSLADHPFATWRKLSVSGRVAVREAIRNRDATQWANAFFELLSSGDSPHEGTWRADIEELKQALAAIAGWAPTSRRNAPLSEGGDWIPPESDFSEQVGTRRSESGIVALDRIQRTLRGIEHELERQHLARAEEYVTDLFAREQRASTPAELVAKTAANIATLVAKFGYLDWAEDLWRQATELSPMDSVARTGLADTVRARGRLGEAEALYRQIQTEFPGAASWAIGGLAEILKAQEHPEKAEALYRDAMRGQAFNTNLASGLAGALRMQGKSAEAREVYHRILIVRPWDTYAVCGLAEVCRNEGDLVEAEELYRALLERDDRDAVPACGLAETLLEMGRADEAEAIYRALIATKPYAFSVRNGLGKALRDQGRLEEAEQLLLVATSQFPEDPYAATGLAEIYRVGGALDLAEEKYREVLALHPENNVVACGLAATLVDKGDLKGAEEIYAALRSSKSSHVAICGLAEIKRQQGDLESARSLYQTVLDTQAFAPVAACGLAATLVELGDLEEAEKMYLRVLAVRSHWAIPKTGLAELLRTAGRLSESEALFRELVQQYPMNRYAANGLAEVLLDLGREGEAFAMREEAITSRPADVINGHAYANLLRRRGSPALALDRLLSLAPRKTKEKRYVAHLTGVVLAELGRVEEAIAALASGLDLCLRPYDRALFLATIAAVQLSRGKGAEAMNSIQGAMELQGAGEHGRAPVGVVAFHALEEVRETSRAEAAKQELLSRGAEPLVFLAIQEIEGVYKRAVPITVADRTRLARMEFELLLRAA